MASKKKRQGHYCRVCGRFRANEKFSGKGHARHICKDCAHEQKAAARQRRREKLTREQETMQAAEQESEQSTE